MTERLRFDAFARWIHDPKLVRPGTRMPSFFLSGKSGFTDLLEGDAHRQVEAVWAYLSQGEFLPMPEGLIDPAGLELAVNNEPIVFRTFIEQAGVRAIACGYPEQVHCAFDAENCRLAAIWEGPFLNAKGAWAARGGSQTNPKQLVWTATDRPIIQLADGGESTSQVGRRFRGYRLDQDRRPVFLYEIFAGGVTISVAEQPLPKRDNAGASLVRRFQITGAPDQRVLIDRGGGASEQALGADGTISFDVEVTW
jgi:hypothetical protein